MTGTQKIAVVVSTYNGQKYIENQLQSIIAQRNVDFDIFIRDDGSTDNTVAVIKRIMESTDTAIFLEEGANVGPTESFFQAVQSVPATYTFIAFCDQDDIWHTDKLSRAMLRLSALDQSAPLLYCAEYNFCDENMRKTGRSHLNRIGIDSSLMLYENICSGNTMVFNRRLADLALRNGTDNIYCHDWWLALVATYFGILVYDDEPCLEYRRTGANASPTGSSPLKLLGFRLRTFIAGGEFGKINAQNDKFLKTYETDLNAQRARVVRTFVNGPRLFKVTYPHRLRQHLHDDVALRLLFLLGY